MRINLRTGFLIAACLTSTFASATLWDDVMHCDQYPDQGSCNADIACTFKVYSDATVAGLIQSLETWVQLEPDNPQVPYFHTLIENRGTCYANLTDAHCQAFEDYFSCIAYEGHLPVAQGCEWVPQAVPSCRLLQ